MPLPKPNQGESKSDFITRCMTVTSAEGKESQQALAICYTQWTGAKKEDEVQSTGKPVLGSRAVQRERREAVAAGQSALFIFQKLAKACSITHSLPRLSCAQYDRDGQSCPGKYRLQRAADACRSSGPHQRQAAAGHDRGRSAPAGLFSCIELHTLAH